MVLFQVFWRTFAQLALAVLLASAGLNWADPEEAKVNAVTLGLGLLMAAVGGVVAVLWAWGLTPATTAMEKALRSAAQAAAGGLAGLVVNSVQDVLSLPTILIGIVIAVVFAFFITLFQYQSAPTTTTGTASTG